MQQKTAYNESIRIMSNLQNQKWYGKVGGYQKNFDN